MVERLATHAQLLPDLGAAPELRGISEWINSPPLTLDALRGQVVLVHFWTFDCINCQHVQPQVKRWHATYADQGLRVVGIHTPELEVERDPANVRAAVRAGGVTFPVGLDPERSDLGRVRQSLLAGVLLDRPPRAHPLHARRRGPLRRAGTHRPRAAPGVSGA